MASEIVWYPPIACLGIDLQPSSKRVRQPGQELGRNGSVIPLNEAGGVTVEPFFVIHPQK